MSAEGSKTIEFKEALERIISQQKGTASAKILKTYAEEFGSRDAVYRSPSIVWTVNNIESISNILDNVRMKMEERAVIGCGDEDEAKLARENAQIATVAVVKLVLETWLENVGEARSRIDLISKEAKNDLVVLKPGEILRKPEGSPN